MLLGYSALHILVSIVDSILKRFVVLSLTLNAPFWKLFMFLKVCFLLHDFILVITEEDSIR